MTKKFGITKQESNKINRIMMVVQTQEEILNAMNNSYRNFMLGIFKRLSIKPEWLKFSKVDMGEGMLIIDVPDKEPKKPKRK